MSLRSSRQITKFYTKKRRAKSVRKPKQAVAPKAADSTHKKRKPVTKVLRWDMRSIEKKLSQEFGSPWWLNYLLPILKQSLRNEGEVRVAIAAIQDIKVSSATGGGSSEGSSSSDKFPLEKVFEILMKELKNSTPKRVRKQKTSSGQSEALADSKECSKETKSIPETQITEQKPEKPEPPSVPEGTVQTEILSKTTPVLESLN
jgi:hypothetical protein